MQHHCLCAAAIASASLFTFVATAEADPFIQRLEENPSDISADGSVVVGQGGSEQPFRWTEGEGAEYLDPILGPGLEIRFFREAKAVSADGVIAVGWGGFIDAAIDPTDAEVVAFRWSPGGVTILDPHLGDGIDTWANDVSGDGSVIVGLSGDFSSGSEEAFLWTAGRGIVPLGDLPGGDYRSTARGISADGSVVVGLGQSADGREAFRWTEMGGMVGLGDLPGGEVDSWANDVSADGSVIVGGGQSADGREAFRWTEGGGMVGLGDLPGGEFNSGALAVSADGAYVVGVGSSAAGGEAFVWNATYGMHGLKALLENAGVDMSDWTLFDATGVAVVGDELIIVGNGGTGDARLHPGQPSYFFGFRASIPTAFPSGLFLNGAPLSVLDVLHPLDLVAGDVLTGSGAINERVTGDVGSTIRATTGPMTLGDPALADGFSTLGLLETGPHAVTLQNDPSGTAVLGDPALGGEVRVVGGTLRIPGGATNRSILYLEGGTVTQTGFTGGGLINEGLLYGSGTITTWLENHGNTWVGLGGNVESLDVDHSVDNFGLIQVLSSSTLHAHQLWNQVGGEIFIGDGSSVLVDHLGFTNWGEVVLNGESAGLDGGGIDNQGTLRGIGTVTDVVDNAGLIHAQSGPLTFQHHVTNLDTGTIKNTDAELTFLGGLENNGAYISDPGDNIFTDLVVGETGYLKGGLGDRFIITGDFRNASRRAAEWDTFEVELIFRQGEDGEHLVELVGSDHGPGAIGFMDNFAWGALVLEAGQSIVFAGGAGMQQGGALYVDRLLLADGLSQLALIDTGGLNIYYNRRTPENAYLGGQALALAGGGRLAPASVAEPATVVVFAIGLLALGWAVPRWRPRRGRGE